jgi:hypothetical protein
MVGAEVKTENNDTWITWSRGEWAGDLLGFRTPQERRDFYDGKSGPFWRLVRREKPARIRLADLAGKESHRS